MPVAYRSVTEVHKAQTDMENKIMVLMFGQNWIQLWS